MAKEEKKSVEKMIENLIDNLLSATVSEQMKDSISSVRDMKRKGEPSKERKKGTRCPEQEEGLLSSGSPGAEPYLKDLGLNKVMNIYNEAQKEIPNLTSDSDTDAEEDGTEGYISDCEGHQEVEEKDQQDWMSTYFKDWESNNVFQFIKDLTMLHCQSEVTDSDSQCGDDESEEKEEKVQRRKSLPRSKGGAGQWRWQEETVEIAIQVHSERNYILLKTFFTGCC